MSYIFPAESNTSFEKRRADVERLRDSSAQYFKVSGEIEVFGAGEAQIRVKFPIRFSGKPVPHFGGELGYGFPAAISGSFPTYSCTILTWDLGVKSDGSFLYVGALLGIVTTGVVDQVMNIHWSVEGMGLRNPSA
jgi:hypothetical protein